MVDGQWAMGNKKEQKCITEQLIKLMNKGMHQAYLMSEF